MKRKYITIERKLAILEEAKDGSLKAIAKQNGICASNIRRWRSNVDKLVELVESGKNVKTCHGGRAMRLLDPYDKDLLDEFDRYRELGRKVSNKTMCRVYRLISKDQSTDIKCLTSMIHRWFVRHKLNLRRVTHVAQNTRYTNKVVRSMLLLCQHM
jgi:hypothetical protein